MSYRDYLQMSLLRESFSPNYIPVAVLVGLFLVLMFRRESINSIGMFRIGYISFIASVVLPPLLQTAWVAMTTPSNSLGSGSLPTGFPFAAINAVEPIFMGVGLLFIFGSLMPRRTKRPQPELPPPQRHPLD